ncbi:hypothetical protein E8E13_007302 [Curvularia kusanoi]|uniref:Peptidase S8/S53 domain-containing protein n=1 Tax=Curvularia kusanoi TaxID=90978 RepID=A0A9P4TK85_CURKU|nr:hypothetical protein E8E13_007302 [Curvularia kusanoi]
MLKERVVQPLFRLLQEMSDSDDVPYVQQESIREEVRAGLQASADDATATESESTLEAVAPVFSQGSVVESGDCLPLSDPQDDLVISMGDQEQRSGEVDRSKLHLAKEFLKGMKKFTGKLQRLPQPNIRICVIDTGLDKSDVLVKGQQKRIVAEKSWVPSDPTVHDNDGHGTHISRLILGNTVSADLLVAKVTNSKTFDRNSVECIVEAIDWAVKHDATIISLSLGFCKDDERIAGALKAAMQERRFVFAAAGNWGLNRPRAFPARQKGVFCIYASDGNGFRDSIDPKNEGRSSFTTLGVAIPSKWKKEDVYVTGTSYAVPIAVSIAATILAYAKQDPNLKEQDWSLLSSYQGMCSVFEYLSAEGEHHRFLSPEQLVTKGHGTKEEIQKAIREVLDFGA